MGELVFLSSGVQMTKGNSLLRRYFSNKDVAQKKILLIGDKEPGWFALCSKTFIKLGFAPQNIFTSREFDKTLASVDIDYIYMAEGNTFQQLQFLKIGEWIPYIMDLWKKGAVYIGVSAGAHIACTSVEPAAGFDDAGMYPVSNFSGLGLFNGVVIPHFSENSILRINAKNNAIKQFTKDRVLLLRNSQMAIINALKTTIVELE